MSLTDTLEPFSNSTWYETQRVGQGCSVEVDASRDRGVILVPHANTQTPLVKQAGQCPDVSQGQVVSS